MNSSNPLYLSAIVFVLMMLGDLLGPLIQAQEMPNRGTVKLATGKGYAPFVDEDLPDGGWSVNLVKRTFSHLSLNIKLEVLPWERALKWTEDNKVLAAFPFVYSEDRAEKFLFSTPINLLPVYMYVAQHSDFSSITQLQGKRLCFPFSYAVGAVEQTIIDRFDMIVNRAKDGFSCIKHVNKGRSDAGLTNGYIDAKNIKFQMLEKESSIRIFNEELGVVPLYLVVSKKHPQAQKWIEEFNYGFSILEANGEKSAIDKQHLKLILN